MSGQCVYTINTNEVFGDGQRKYIQVETHHPDLMALAHDLRAGPVVLTQLVTRRTDEPGVFEILNRREVMITWSYVFSAYVPDGKRYVEYEEAEGAAR